MEPEIIWREMERREMMEPDDIWRGNRKAGNCGVRDHLAGK